MGRQTRARRRGISHPKSPGAKPTEPPPRTPPGRAKPRIARGRKPARAGKKPRAETGALPEKAHRRPLRTAAGAKGTTAKGGAAKRVFFFSPGQAGLFRSRVLSRRRGAFSGGEERRVRTRKRAGPVSRCGDQRKMAATPRKCAHRVTPKFPFFFFLDFGSTLYGVRPVTAARARAGIRPAGAVLCARNARRARALNSIARARARAPAPRRRRPVNTRRRSRARTGARGARMQNQNY